MKWYCSCVWSSLSAFFAFEGLPVVLRFFAGGPLAAFARALSASRVEWAMACRAPRRSAGLYGAECAGLAGGSRTRTSPESYVHPV